MLVHLVVLNHSVPEIVDGGRHGEGRVLQLVDLLRVTQKESVVDHL